MADSYVPDKKKRKYRRFYLILIYALSSVYLVLAATGWFFLKSPFWRAEKIEITGNSAVSKDEIMDTLRPVVLDHNFWKWILGFDDLLAWPKTFSSADLVFLPGLKNLELEKSYRDRSVTVNAVERTAFGIWCVGEDNCWWFDDGGFVFKRAISGEGSLINTVRDYSDHKLGLNLKILPEEIVPNVMSIFKVLGASGLNVKEMVLRDLALKEMEVSTYDGPKIYFSLSFPADSSREVINDLRAKAGFQKLQYLDFRVENKLYYK